MKILLEKGQLYLLTEIELLEPKGRGSNIKKIFGNKKKNTLKKIKIEWIIQLILN